MAWHQVRALAAAPRLECSVSCPVRGLTAADRDSYTEARNALPANWRRKDLPVTLVDRGSGTMEP